MIQKDQTTGNVEMLRPVPSVKWKAAVFDSDGTVNRIRTGWFPILDSYFTEVLQAACGDMPHDQVVEEAREIIDRYTGDPTIFQCEGLSRAVVQHGGTWTDPEVHKQVFLKHMSETVGPIWDGLKTGTISPDSYLVRGSRELITALEQAGVKCAIASGTDDAAVKEDMRLLGIDRLCSLGVTGAVPGMIKGVKSIVLERLIEEGYEAETILVIGDGSAEMRIGKELGCYTIGVASDDSGLPKIDLRKRSLLIQSGADMIVPDFSEYGLLTEILGVTAHNEEVRYDNN